MPNPLPPIPTGHLILGNFREFNSNAYQSMREWQKLHGDLIRFRMGPVTIYVVSHPELVEDILIERPEQFIKMYLVNRPKGLALILGQGLITSTGALWKRQRKLIQPLFVKSRVAEYEGEIVAAGRNLVSHWQGFAPSTPVDIGAEMMRTTLEVITRTMFNISVLDQLVWLEPALQTVLEFAADDMRNPLSLPRWLPTRKNREFQSAMQSIDQLVYGLIRERRDAAIPKDDLLDRLIRATDDETGLPMDDRQIRDEVLTIFTAGHETTALTLTWACYMLACHPIAADRLKTELDTVLGDREPTTDDLPRLAWTRAVLDETLRLYPPAAVMVRENVSETLLGGYRIPKGSMLIINLANIHRHPEFWEMPDSFQPERFLPEQFKPKHRLAFMPFGAGHRLCVGNAFALTESMLLLAMIAKHYRFETLPGESVEPELEVTLRPKGGVRLAVTPR